MSYDAIQMGQGQGPDGRTTTPITAQAERCCTTNDQDRPPLDSDRGGKQTQSSTKEETETTCVSCARLGPGLRAAPLAATWSECRCAAENQDACACCRPDPRTDPHRICNGRLPRVHVTHRPIYQMPRHDRNFPIDRTVCSSCLDAGWHMALRRMIAPHVWGPAFAAAL